jgi:hypothetical protein
MAGEVCVVLSLNLRDMHERASNKVSNGVDLADSNHVNSSELTHQKIESAKKVPSPLQTSDAPLFMVICICPTVNNDYVSETTIMNF